MEEEFKNKILYGIKTTKVFEFSVHMMKLGFDNTVSISSFKTKIFYAYSSLNV